MQLNRMLVAIAAGVLSLGLCTGAQAQQQQRPRNRGQQIAIPAPWLERLNLDEAQKAKVKAATEALMAEQQKIQTLAQEERRQAFMTARTNYETAIKGTLNADQSKKLEAMRAEAMQYMALGPIGNQLVGLNLTDEQKAKVKEIGAKYQPEMEKLRAEMQNTQDRQALQMKQRELSMKVFEDIKAVLTPEQQKNFMPIRRRPNQN